MDGFGWHSIALVGIGLNLRLLDDIGWSLCCLIYGLTSLCAIIIHKATLREASYARWSHAEANRTARKRLGIVHGPRSFATIIWSSPMVSSNLLFSFSHALSHVLKNIQIIICKVKLWSKNQVVRSFFGYIFTLHSESEFQIRLDDFLLNDSSGFSSGFGVPRLSKLSSFKLKTFCQKEKRIVGKGLLMFSMNNMNFI